MEGANAGKSVGLGGARGAGVTPSLRQWRTEEVASRRLDSSHGGQLVGKNATSPTTRSSTPYPSLALASTAGAVQYFPRTLKLNQTYLSAWALLGRTPPTVNVSGREYRTQYGLSQMYEIMNTRRHQSGYAAGVWCAVPNTILSGVGAVRSSEKKYPPAVRRALAA